MIRLNGKVSPLTVQLLIHIYCMGDDIPHRESSAQQSILNHFWMDGVITYGGVCDHGLILTGKGKEWLDRILSVGPAELGPKEKGFYIIGKNEAAFRTAVLARIEAMQKIDGRYGGYQQWYGQGAYVLKAIELNKLFPHSE